ncbi:MAG: EamA family transporter [Deltaproteobacteria bacterium]|nr:EamA family transporter [Deltaproteobacteria bacterium]
MCRSKDAPNKLMPYFLIIGAAILWASAGTTSKYLFNAGMSPYTLAQFRVSFSSLIIFGYLLAFSRDILRIRVRDLPYLVVLGALGMGGVQVTYLYAISKIKVAMAILLQYLAPFFVATYSWLFLRESMDRWKVLSILLAFMGCVLVVEAYRVSFLTLNIEGVIAGLLSAGFFSFYSLLGERAMGRYSPWTTLFYALVFSAVLFNIAMPIRHIIAWKAELRWCLSVVYIIVCGTVLPFGLYYMGVEHLRSTRASIVATLEPISAGFLSFIFLGETLTPWQIFGGLLVIIAIVIIQSRREIDLEAPIYKRKVNHGVS